MTMVWSRNKKFSTRNNPHCAQNLQKKARPRSPKQLPEQKFLNQIFVLTWACRDSSASFHPRCTSQSQPLAHLLCYLLYWQIKCLCYYLVSLPICRGVPETPQEKQQECIAGEGYSAMVPTSCSLSAAWDITACEITQGSAIRGTTRITTRSGRSRFHGLHIFFEDWGTSACLYVSLHIEQGQS